MWGREKSITEKMTDKWETITEAVQTEWDRYDPHLQDIFVLGAISLVGVWVVVVISTKISQAIKERLGDDS